jgi:squalene-hopene/tetraprenyl-beta-curcumene cyclase
MRRLLALLLCALLTVPALSAAAMAAAPEQGRWTVLPTDRLPADRAQWWPDPAALAVARQAAFDWLQANQASDGTWGSDFGVTALGAFALLNGGTPADHPMVARALDHVLAQAKEDGSFSEGTYVNYYTATAVMALSAAGRPADEQIVKRSVNKFVAEQFNGDEQGFVEWWRGGLGYSSRGRADLSNTQFAMMALAAAEAAYPSIVVPAATWQNALLFLHRSQNLPEVNDLDWADNASSPSFNDGGFVYLPGDSKAGGTKSYGSMTAAGLWGLLAAGGTTSSRDAAAALDWLGAHFSATENPGFGQAAYYYYAWTAARALRSAGAPALLAPDGHAVYWAKELASAVIARQEGNGRWWNDGAAFYWEERPEVASMFALLSLEAMMPSDAGLRVRAPDGGSVTITDASGRSNADTPGFFQGSDGTVGVAKASDGPYTVTVTDGPRVEVAPVTGGTVKVWREVALARGGGSLVADVAPLLGPASLVVAGVTTAAATSAAGLDATQVAAIAVTVAVVAIAIWTWRTRKG